MSGNKIDGQPTGVMPDLYKKKNSMSGRPKPSSRCHSEKPWPITQFPDISQFTGPKSVESRAG